MADDVAKRAYDFYISQGLAPHQAAAMVGHMMAESGGNPTIQEAGGKGPGYGAFQWTTPSRRAGLDTFAKSGTGVELDPNKLETQLLYSLRELDTTEKKAGDQLYGSKDYTGAVNAGMHYLRPAGYTPDNPQGGHNYAGRHNYGAGFVGAQPMMGPTMAAAGGSQQPTGGLLQAQPTGIDAEIAQWSGMEPPGGREALNKVVAADAAKSANAYAAAGAAASKMGQEMVASGAPKQQQWQNLQASVHQPQQLAQMPNLMGGGDFQQQLAQSRLGSFAPKKRSPFDEEFG